MTNPSLTKSNASITWTVSERVALSECTVTFPNGTVVNETCNDQWEAIDLPRGTYQISIVLVDAAGNIGGAFRHTWTNSKRLINMIKHSKAFLFFWNCIIFYNLTKKTIYWFYCSHLHLSLNCSSTKRMEWSLKCQLLSWPMGYFLVRTVYTSKYAGLLWQCQAKVAFCNQLRCGLKTLQYVIW